MATAPRLAEVLRYICPPDSGNLDVDVAEMRFCDCAGLSVLLAAAQRRRARGGRLMLVNPPTALRRLIGLVGLTGLEEALGIPPRTKSDALDIRPDVALGEQ